MKHIRLGISGDAGSFSEEAGQIYSTKIVTPAELHYLIDMEGVLSALAQNQIDRGIFPVVNLQGGFVRMAFDAMGHHSFRMIDDLWLDVHQCLLVKPGVVMSQIKTIVSHSQALAQCRNYLSSHLTDVCDIEYQDTAKAAKDLSQGKLEPTSAVIAPERAAHLYGLEVLAKDIQDCNPNLTGFIIVTSDSKSNKVAFGEIGLQVE